MSAPWTPHHREGRLAPVEEKEHDRRHGIKSPDGGHVYEAAGQVGEYGADRNGQRGSNTEGKAEGPTAKSEQVPKPCRDVAGGYDEEREECDCPQCAEHVLEHVVMGWHGTKAILARRHAANKGRKGYGTGRYPKLR